MRSIRKKLIFLIFIGLLAAPLLLQGADLYQPQYPRLANLFFRWDITTDETQALAKWDIVIVDMDVQTYSPDKLKELKKINPNIKILAYLASQEIRGDSGTLTGTLRQKLFQRIEPAWWLKDIQGQSVAWWPGNPLINVTSLAPARGGQRWADVLPDFIQTELMAQGYWDGVFVDNAWDTIDFLKDLQVDLNQDGQAESVVESQIQWQAGMNILLSNLRQKLGPDKLIIGNGGESYYQYLNGVLYEHFPSKGWAETLNKYRDFRRQGYAPALAILNSNVSNSGRKDDYATMRFGLASALMDEGYYSFDNGDQSHAETWWYDEYEAYLGEPVRSPVNILNGQAADFQPGLWRRDFKNGLVLVNSTNRDRFLDLGGEFEKIHGNQDPAVNDGSFVSQASLGPSEGLILLRPIDKIFNGVYTNGSFARVFNRFGHLARTGFFVYNEKFRGGVKVQENEAASDQRFIIADKNKVEIYNNEGAREIQFYPYGQNYKGEINLVVGDLDGKAGAEIVTGAGAGGGPQVRVFNLEGRLINSGFFAYDKKFRGGVSVALGDVNGDGRVEIITGPGAGEAPQVKVFDASGRVINAGFFVYDKKFQGGVNVASGDINGDGRAEIITGAGAGGGPQVRVFNANGKLAGPSFFAFDASLRQGVKVLATDTDGDGRAEIVTMSSDVFTLAGL